MLTITHGINTTNVQASLLPCVTQLLDAGTTVTFAFNGTVSSTVTETRYVLDSVTGNTTSTYVTVSSGAAVAATYTTQTFEIDSFGSNGNSNTNTITVSSLNCKVGDVVIVLVSSRSSTSISSVTGGGLTWTPRASIDEDSHTRIWEYYAIVTGSPLTSVTVTISSYENLNVIVFGISGADTDAPFDGSARTADASSYSYPTVTGVSTSNNHDMIIGLEGHRTSTDATAGLIAGTTGTLIDALHHGGSSSYSSAAAEYRIVTGTVSSQSVAFGNAQSNSWAMIVEAVQRAW
jgi:hypothetical protein